MDVIVCPRQAGKTTNLIEWVRQGGASRLYPFWTRVIVTASEREAHRLRSDYNLDYNRVYSLDDWQSARIIENVEVAIDNADVMLQHVIRQGRLAVVTLTEG